MHEAQPTWLAAAYGWGPVLLLAIYFAVSNALGSLIQRYYRRRRR